ncbi:hypothetical protein MPL1032_60022 [Mesorhizobium plurifarium]|uniref:Uncharacterized protein n=1 Tax=Mesorhizobium plurifarium TaxID=69974 RepID=A0A0K2W5X5_MESPL|nr:hypothetical protein MPL1032_60022 [Mesorhizobium plurifarium]
MTSRSETQTYVNNFRRNIAPHLAPNFGIAATVYEVPSQGGIVEFNIAAIPNRDEFISKYNSLDAALSNIKQSAFGGNLKAFKFSGTNTIVEGNRIIFIKDNNKSEWSEIAAAKDVKNVLFQISQRSHHR